MSGDVVDHSLQATFNSCLQKELKIIATSYSPASFGPEIVEEWNLPDSDRSALRRWGIPVMDSGNVRPSVQLAGSIQKSDYPEINERNINAYFLGKFWRRKIGATAGTGVVIGLPDDPSLDVSYINSSVSAFIDIAWRWDCARRTLLEIHDYQQLYQCLARFQKYVHSLDPLVRDNPQYSWWNGIIEGW